MCVMSIISREVKTTQESSRLKSWIVDRLAEGMHQKTREPAHFLAFIIRNLWGKGFDSA